MLLSLESVLESSVMEDIWRSSELAVEVVDGDLVVDLAEEEEEEALVEMTLVEEGVEEGVEDTAGELTGLLPVPLPVSFVQSFVLSLQRYPRSQHRPDWQIGPPLQVAPLHTG